MPRYPCLFIPGATYHVYCRVARGEFVFDDPLETEDRSFRKRVDDLDRRISWSARNNPRML